MQLYQKQQKAMRDIEQYVKERRPLKIIEYVIMRDYGMSEKFTRKWYDKLNDIFGDTEEKKQEDAN